jgi:hypothetical protein
MTALMLFHISEDAGIERFEPRPSEYASEPVVWAIDSERLRNYLLPRDCPRVTYYAGDDAAAADIERDLGSSAAVVAIERAWWTRVRACRLYCYHLLPDDFECLDDGAGYFVSRAAVVPQRVEVFDDVIEELLKRGVELRMVASLWPLRDAILESSLQFSMIRMRNAVPRAALETDSVVAADECS